jgi:hypothetical protein
MLSAVLAVITVLLAASDRGAIVGNLVARQLRRQIPILTAGRTTGIRNG